MGNSRTFLRWPTRRSKEWLARFLAEASHEPDILAVVAIGSGVRPGVKSNDLDLVVVRTGPPARVDAPIEVDLRHFQAEEIDLKVQEGNDLLGWAAIFGIPLVDKDRFWTRFVDRHRGRIPMPSAQVARDRAQKAQTHVERLLDTGDEEAAAEQLVSMLTHLARAALVETGTYPASRPELPGQLRARGEHEIADALEQAIFRERPAGAIYRELLSFHT